MKKLHIAYCGLILAGVNAASPALAHSDEIVCGKTYVVEGADTLSNISEWAYGTATRGNDIYAANADKIGPDPSALNIGMELIIPCIDGVEPNTAASAAEIAAAEAKAEAEAQAAAAEEAAAAAAEALAAAEAAAEEAAAALAAAEAKAAEAEAEAAALAEAEAAAQAEAEAAAAAEAEAAAQAEAEAAAAAEAEAAAQAEAEAAAAAEAEAAAQAEAEAAAAAEAEAAAQAEAEAAAAAEAEAATEELLAMSDELLTVEGFDPDKVLALIDTLDADEDAKGTLRNAVLAAEDKPSLLSAVLTNIANQLNR